MTNMKSQDSLATQTTHSKIGDYERKATIYLFTQLEALYGTKWRQTFNTPESLQHSRRLFARDIGKLSREDIDCGLDELRGIRETGDEDFIWPDLSLIIGLFNGNYESKQPFQHQSKAYVSFKDQDKNALPHLPMARSEALKKLKAGNPFKKL